MGSGYPNVVVIGAGPTGLGAAWRLNELGHPCWRVVEAAAKPGGLASSFIDKRGFTWDYGCHVFHSHYAYVDAVLAALGDYWIEHRRDAWVWLRQRWIPYPLQNNIWRLPPDDVARCLDDLLQTVLTPTSCESARSFGEWLRASFGQSLFELFMEPYNRKVWSYPPDQLDVGWMKDRVARVDVRRVVRNVVLQADDTGWGPNANFRYPRRGGTGAIWETLAKMLPSDHLTFGRRVVAIHASTRKIILDSGEEIPYDYLISAMPLDQLLGIIRDMPELRSFIARFVRTSTHVVGLGFEGLLSPEACGKSWIYFPDSSIPFHRVSVHSNYSRYNVSRPGAQWSLLAEISESPHRPVDCRCVVDDTLADLKRCGLVREETPVVSRWHRRLEYGYPTPWLGRDDVIGPVNASLESRGILSRGRFGAWKYEVSNQDHCFMQGAEAVERVLRDGTECTFLGEMKDSIEPVDPPPRMADCRLQAVWSGVSDLDESET